MKNWILFIITAVVVFLLGMLASSVINRKNEAKFAKLTLDKMLEVS